MVVRPEELTSTRYAILGRLATGGMAEIFLARPSGEDSARHVVLKRILPELARDPTFVQMFLDEARLVAQMSHPNIARVFETGRLGDSYFFTMEYVHGVDVRHLLGHLATVRQAIPLGHVLHVVAGAAAGLDHAHERSGPDRKPLGIVHRDVSPANIMLGFDGSVKLVDFGVAKATIRMAQQTHVGMVKGKVAYLSPEQCRGRDVDRRSDVFSLGIVMYEMLTGERLFRRETDYHTMTAVLNYQPPPPSTYRPEVSSALDKVVLCALAKDREARYATAREMLEAVIDTGISDDVAMSETSIGTYLRELFGDRPEPWLGDQNPDPGLPPDGKVREVFDVDAAIAEIEEHQIGSRRRSAVRRAESPRGDGERLVTETLPTSTTAVTKTMTPSAPSPAVRSATLPITRAARPPRSPEATPLPVVKVPPKVEVAKPAARGRPALPPPIPAAAKAPPPPPLPLPPPETETKPALPSDRERPAYQDHLFDAIDSLSADTAEEAATMVRDPSLVSLAPELLEPLEPTPTPLPPVLPDTIVDTPTRPTTLRPPSRPGTADFAIIEDETPEPVDERLNSTPTEIPVARPRRRATKVVATIAAFAVVLAVFGFAIAVSLYHGDDNDGVATVAIVAPAPPPAPAAVITPSPSPSPSSPPAPLQSETVIDPPSPGVAAIVTPKKPLPKVIGSVARPPDTLPGAPKSAMRKRASSAEALLAIRTAIAKHDHSGALSQCASVRRHNSATRSACAIAACGSDRGSDARRYARGLSGSRRTAITRTCLARGVAID